MNVQFEMKVGDICNVSATVTLQKYNVKIFAFKVSEKQGVIF